MIRVYAFWRILLLTNLMKVNLRTNFVFACKYCGQKIETTIFTNQELYYRKPTRQLLTQVKNIQRDFCRVFEDRFYDKKYDLKMVYGKDEKVFRKMIN